MPCPVRRGGTRSRSESNAFADGSRIRYRPGAFGEERVWGEARARERTRRDLRRDRRWRARRCRVACAADASLRDRPGVVAYGRDRGDDATKRSSRCFGTRRRRTCLLVDALGTWLAARHRRAHRAARDRLHGRSKNSSTARRRSSSTRCWRRRRTSWRSASRSAGTSCRSRRQRASFATRWGAWRSDWRGVPPAAYLVVAGFAIDLRAAGEPIEPKRHVR